MTRWNRALLGCALFFATTSGIGHTEPNEADSVLNRLQERYDSTTDYTADFDQKTEYRTVNRTINGKGKVYFSKPAKMLWLYEKPEGQFVLADGTHLYFYQPDEKQVIKTSLGAAFRSDLPLSFLLGIGKIRSDFRSEIAAQEGDDYVVNLYPRQNNTGLRTLQLLITARNYDIKRAQIEDVGGNRWTIDFSNIERGIGLEPSVFDLKTPDGVDIVEFGS
jgi:outer membrane lipoprotein carrier protein